jgi:protein O-GlcNAc transferase
MTKVFSFSLWGNEPTYNIGAIKNAEFIKKNFPQFECWFYVHQETVPINTINELKLMDNVKIILKSGNLDTEKPMMWRFEAIDDPKVEIMMSRDTDTRIWEREILAVKEWLTSDKIFHIMRDHPHHGDVVPGGMFGTKKNSNIPSWIDLMKNFKQNSNRQYDQHFLKDFIYPHIINDSLIHASFHKWENHAKPFPISYNNEFNFVGEYVYYNESRSLKHIEILKEAIKNQ